MSYGRILAISGCLLLAACSSWSASESKPQATADLRNGSGQSVGTVAFFEEKDGVRIAVKATGLPPGKHGIHIHTVAKCDPPDFTSAGGHFNPTGKSHGLQNPAGPHAGDLPNLVVGADGKGSLEYTNKLISVSSGPNAISGASVVIHAGPDDERTDPAGNSGARIACGVVRKS